MDRRLIVNYGEFNRKRYYVVLSALITLLFMPNVYAVSPFWPMPFHDPQNTGQSDYIGSNTSLLNWQFPIGNISYASPVVAGDGTVYVISAYNLKNNVTYAGEGTILYAINPDGTEKWHFGTGATFFSPVLGHDGTIYISSSDGNLYAINPDRTLKWTYSTGSSVLTSPVLDSQGDVYIGLGNESLVAVNPNGVQKWSFVTGLGVTAPAIGTDNTVYTGGTYNPRIMPGLSFGTGDALYAINPDGTEKWKLKLFGPFFTTVGRDNTIYLAEFFGGLNALNPDGTTKWSVRTGEVVGPPALSNDGTIYFGGEKRIFAVNSDGKIKWTFDTAWESFGFSAPAMDANGIVYVVNNNGIVYAINPDGTIKWSYSIGSRNQNGSGYSPAIGPSQIIYVAYNHFLYAIGNLSSTSVQPKTTSGSSGNVGTCINCTVINNLENNVSNTVVGQGKSSVQSKIEINSNNTVNTSPANNTSLFWEVVGSIAGVGVAVALFFIFVWGEGVKKKSRHFTLEKFFENGKEYVRILNSGKTIEACIILCKEEPCRWWNDNSILPRHIQTGGGGNVLLPQDAEDTNPVITVMSGKQVILKMKLKDIVLTHP